MADAPLVPSATSRFAPGWKVAIVDDGRGVADALATTFAARGVTVASPEDAQALVYLGGLRPFAGTADAIAVHREAFQLAHLHANTFAAQGGAFITVQDTGGDFGTSGLAGDRAWGAGLPGLVKTAAQEWPPVIAKAIDIECAGLAPDAIAQRLVSEILHGGAELEVGLHADGRRTTLRTEVTGMERAARATPVLDERSVVVASGGGRGVTAAALVALARDSRSRFALLGRTALVDEPASLRDCHTEEALKRQLLTEAKAAGTTPAPRVLHQQASAIINAREVRATLDALRAAGAEAEYFAVDIQDEVALHAALEAIRSRWGGIHALVHGAGVLADKPIARKTVEEFDRVMSVKVDGLRHLLAATAADELRAICCFSSIVARTGNAGQADYAAANMVLDAVAAAESRRRDGRCVVKSINWGPWAGGMVTPALAEHFRARGMAPIPLDEGARAFVTEIQGAPSAAVTVLVT